MFWQREVFETENRKLKFDGHSFSFSGDRTDGFSKVFANGFCSRLNSVGLFTQIYKDAIDLTSRWKVCFRHFFFQNEVQQVLYKLVLVTYPLNHFQRIECPLNFRFIQKRKKKRKFSLYVSYNNI